MKAKNLKFKKIKRWKHSSVSAYAIHTSPSASSELNPLVMSPSEGGPLADSDALNSQPILNSPILIVDSSASDRATYRRFLEDDFLMGDRILEAETLKAGIDLWRSQHPCWVLINFDLPDGEGLDLLKIMAEGKSKAQLSVIVLADQKDEKSALLALQFGAMDYLVKSEITAFSLRQSLHCLRDRHLAARSIRNAYNELSEDHAALTLRHEQLQQTLEQLTLADQDLKKQNLQLSSERQRYQNLFNFAPDGYLVTNTMGIIREVNQAILDQLSVTRDYLIGKPFFSFFARQNYTQFYDRLDQMLTIQQRQTWEMMLQPEQGSLFPAEVTVTLNYYDETTDETRLLWFVRDITERERSKTERIQAEIALKQLNQELENRVEIRTNALQQSESRLREAQKVAKLGSWEFDVSTGEVVWSPEIFAIFGLDPNQLPLAYEQLTPYIHPDDQDRRLKLIHRALDWAEPYEVDLRIVRADRSPGYIFSKGQPVCNRAGQVIRVFGIMMDISDRKLAQEKLQTLNVQLEEALEQERKLSQLKDDFLSTVSHELRTPITSIKMATTMLEKKFESLDLLLSESNAIQRYFQILHKEVQRESTLINDLLEMTRLDAGTEALNLNTIVFEQFIPDLVTPFVPLAQSQQQQLEIEMPQDINPFTTDHAKLERILTELLANACKYSPAKSLITLSAQVTPIALEICVSNTGVEISIGERDRIFEKFYRIPNNDPWKHGGTGLGLALVKKLTERIGGTITVDSGNGRTQFTVFLPWEILTRPTGESLSLKRLGSSSSVWQTDFVIA